MVNGKNDRGIYSREAYNTTIDNIRVLFRMLNIQHTYYSIPHGLVLDLNKSYEEFLDGEYGHEKTMKCYDVSYSFYDSENGFWELGNAWSHVENMHAMRDLNENGYRSYTRLENCTDGIQIRINVKYKKYMSGGQGFLAGFTFGVAASCDVKKKQVESYCFNGKYYSTMREAEAARASMIGRIDGSPSTNVNGIITQKKITGWNRDGKVTTAEYHFNGQQYGTMREAEAARASMIGRIDGTPSTNVDGIITQNKITGWTQAGKVTTTEYIFNGQQYRTLAEAQSVARLAQYAKNLYDKAWEKDKEANRDSVSEEDSARFQEEAIDLFLRAQDAYERLVRECPSNSFYLQRLLAIQLRITGDKNLRMALDLERQGIELEREAHDDRNAGKLREALDKLTQAQQKYKEAEEHYTLANDLDERNTENLEFVRTRLGDIDQEIAKLTEEINKQDIVVKDEDTQDKAPPKKHNSTTKKHKGLDNLILNRASTLDFWLDYNEATLSKMLDLRLKSLNDNVNIMSKTSVLDSIYLAKLGEHNAYNFGAARDSLISLVKLVISRYAGNPIIENILVPILIPQSKDTLHWVGMMFKNLGTQIDVNYTDSENVPILEIYRDTILSYLQQLLPQTNTTFTQIKVEEQRYNNCGLELIENFIQMLTGTRVSQENAPYLHSELLVQKLIMDDIQSVIGGKITTSATLTNIRNISDVGLNRGKDVLMIEGEYDLLNRVSSEDLREALGKAVNNYTSYAHCLEVSDYVVISGDGQFELD